MILTLIGFVVGGTTFAVPVASQASPTAVSNLALTANLTDFGSVRATGSVSAASSGAGARGAMQCSPDGSTWTTMVEVNLGSTGVKSTSGSTTNSWDTVPPTCRVINAQLRAALYGGNTGNVTVAILAIEFAR